MGRRFFYIVVFLTVFSLSCDPDNSSTSSQTNVESVVYFDLESYFKNEIAKLENQDQLISKTVIADHESEEKKVKIKDWNRELALFIQSDINKDAWKGSYRVDSNTNHVKYTSIDPSLRTKSISIVKDINGQIKGLEIENKQDNMLYQTEERLYYYPDSLYQIERSQKIRIVGEHVYKITGVF